MNFSKPRTIFAITSFAIALTMSARAQDVVTIDPKLAQQHLIHKVEAQYPADAQAAQVQGTVVLRLSIDTTGHVTNAEVSSGPQLLQQAAVDAVRQWVYKPFAIGGKALDAAAEVNVVFTLPASAAQAPPSYTPSAAPAAAAAPPPAAVAPPQETVAAAPPADTNSGFGSPAGPATGVAPTAAPATPNAGFESASPPPDSAPLAAPATPVNRPAPATSGFESAAPPPEGTPVTPAAAAPAAGAPAMESAAPVESAPTPIQPAADAAPSATEATPATPENFGALSTQCHKLMAAHADVNSVVTICGAMATAADSLPSDSRFIERRAAYVFDAAALLRAWRYPEAEAMAARAVALVEEGHDDFTGASAAYAVLGNAQALNGKLAQADKNLETAETLERKALEAASAQQQQVYSTTLRTILLFHADTLDRMGNKSSADAKRAEAAKLLPVAG
jgi:TonB family protein